MRPFEFWIRVTGHVLRGVMSYEEPVRSGRFDDESGKTKGNLRA
jgi:hypothetical protein